MTITITKKYIKFLQTIHGNTTTTGYITKQIIPTDDAVLGIPLDKLFELYGNLILNGFSPDEATHITATVAANATRTV